jgi:amidase
VQRALTPVATTDLGADPLSGDADALTIAAAVRAGAVSARDVVAAAVTRAEATDAELNYLVAERFEQALDEADRVDRAAPLAGVPVLMKDFLATVAGLPLTEGTMFVEGWVPPRDSEYVARLRRAGVIVLGSATTAELAVLSSCETARHGVTRNPVAPECTTGGSSGGSAAAVAAGAVPVAHGSDAGGSIRMPAACCGLVGLKPTRGRNPLGPVHGDLSAGTWTEHVIARTARDSAAFLDATSGPAPGDPYAAPAPRGAFLDAATREPRPLRVAVASALPSGRALHPQSARAVALTAARLEALGHEVEEGAPRFDLAAAEEDFFTLFAAGLASRLDLWADRLGRAAGAEDVDPYTWHLAERGRATAAPDLLSAIDRLQGHARSIAAFFETADVWLTPTLGIPPFPLGWLSVGPEVGVEELLARDALFTAFTWPFNMTGQPAVSCPAHVAPDGTPIGVQFAARFGDEETLLEIAAELERTA